MLSNRKWFRYLLIFSILYQECHAIDTTIRLGFLFDTGNFDWVEDIFNFVLSLINDKADGWHDDIFANEVITLEGYLVDSGCDESIALDAYWNGVRKNNTPPHAIVGARCSGASSIIARISGLERIPQVSPTSTSAKLSSTEEYPYFSRTVAPDDGRGQVGAMVAMLRGFGWNRVGILTTDTDYSKDFANEFRRLWLVSEKDDEGKIWEGEVPFTNAILLDAEKKADEDSIYQALAGVPTDDPTINSRVILLLAHAHHAYPILEAAAKVGFQPDTIWVGIDGWVEHDPITTDWIPPFPGYLGLAPYSSENEDSQDFLSRLQQYQLENEMEVWESIEDHRVGHVVDSIVALAKALSLVEDRRDGDAVVSALRNLTFDGITGEVSFTPAGDRHKPRFSISNLQRKEDGDLTWENVAYTGIEVGSLSFGEEICFADIGCVNDFNSQVPSDKYDIPPALANYRTELWTVIALPIVAILLIIFAFRYWRTKQKKKALKSSISIIQQKLKIDDQLDNLNDQIDVAKKQKENLIRERFRLQQKPITWTDTDKTLVEVMPRDSEYWEILDNLRQDLPNAFLSKVWRVQNLSLWTYYSFHKDRFVAMGIDENERSVWHGTSNLDPEVIYSDKQDGFMMQFSQAGFWGRGLYFAEKGSYSHMYAYKPPVSRKSFRGFSMTEEERPRAEKEDEREMFLAKLLVGSEIFMNRKESPQREAECKKLTVPPSNPETNLKYNTVSGETSGSKIWVVYENGRAYPEYLVRYYQSPVRDVNRTPYENMAEAHKEEETAPLPTAPLAPSNEPLRTFRNYQWEYLDNDGWRRYLDTHQASLEDGYQAYMKQTGIKKMCLKTDSWNYEIRFLTMTQVNLQHPNHRERKVRRIEKSRRSTL